MGKHHGLCLPVLSALNDGIEDLSSMRINRIRPGEPRGDCYNCHSPADIEVTWGEKNPTLKLCFRDAKYLGDFLVRRVAEHDRGEPIPVPRARDDAWRNR